MNEHEWAEVILEWERLEKYRELYAPTNSSIEMIIAIMKMTADMPIFTWIINRYLDENLLHTNQQQQKQ